MLGFRGLKFRHHNESVKATTQNVVQSTESTSDSPSSHSTIKTAMAPTQISSANGKLSLTNGKGEAPITAVPTKSSNGNGEATAAPIPQVSKSTNHIAGRQLTILRDTVQRTTILYRSELKNFDEFFKSCLSIDQFFDYVAGIRLREIPHHGSQWDKVLKWAEFFGAQVYGYSEEASFCVTSSDRAALIIWACCKSLLKLGRENVVLLERVFNLLYSVGLNLGFFLRHHELLHQTEELQSILAACYTDLFKLVTGIHLYYTHKHTEARFSTKVFNEVFGRQIDILFSYSVKFTDAVWSTRFKGVSESEDISVEAIRGFLTPHDRVTRLIATTRIARRARADFTGEWFDRHLATFLRQGKHILVVSGKARSGKTFLSDWVIERLQTLHGRRASEVLSYTIDPDLKTELTTLSVVKGLLLQLLQLNVGDNSLYKSLHDAYDIWAKGSAPQQVEAALWSSLETGLASGRYHTFVIDGIDQLNGGEGEVAKLLDQLHSIAARRTKTKVIVFSRDLAANVTQKHSYFALTTENTRQDVRYFAESLISASSFFDVLTENDRPTLITKLAHYSDGSFEWVVQAVDLLKTETTSEGILKSVDSLPKTMDAITDKVISAVDLKQKDTKSLLAWTLVSQRPLLLTEVAQLFEVDSAHATRVSRTTKVEEDIVRSLGTLVTIDDGFVRFSSPVIKHTLLQRATSVTDFKNTGAFPFHIQEAHYDLTVRSLAYIKMSLTASTPPTLSLLGDSELDNLFNKHEFLSYASRYWAWHFQASPMHEPTVRHKITTGFKAVFPRTALLSIIEGSCYPYQTTYHEAIDFHLLTLSVRRLVLGDINEAVLQTLLNLAVLKQTTFKPPEVNEFYYEAWKISSSLKLAAIATTCAHRYIQHTSTVTITSKSTIATRRSELLEYVIRIYRETSVSQKEILVYLELLVTLYVTTGETEKVTKLRKEIYELNLKIYGRNAPQTLQAHSHLVSVISKSTNTGEIEEITEARYREISRTKSATDSERVKLTWDMIAIYSKRKDITRVEELLVWLWQSWTHHGISHKDSKTQQQQIDIALRYVQFLKEHDRKAEAENILRGVVIDMDDETDDEEIIQRKRKIGYELSSLGAVAAARSVFQKCWAWYTKKGKTSTAEAKSVSTELERSTHESFSETTTESYVLREYFDTIVTKSTTKTIDSRTIHTSMTLIETYWAEQRWTEVVQVSTVLLTRMWVSWTSTEIRSPLPTQDRDETISIIRRLYNAYLKLRQSDKAEYTLRRLFYAVLVTTVSSDELLFSSFKNLVDFYETHGMVEKSVTIHRDIYPEIEKRKGKTDAFTIRTLYALGDSSMRVNDIKNAEFAYSAIHVSLGPEICHRDAIRAAQALITVYEQQHQYAAARKIYLSVWQMFLKHGKDYELKSDWAEDLHEKYVRNLKQDEKVEYSTRRQLASDYYKALVKFYGSSHDSAIKATVGLGEIVEENPANRGEAIMLYEEADQKLHQAPKGSISKPTVHLVESHRKRLPHLYSTSELSTSPKAIPLYQQEWQAYNSKHGHAHSDSLKWLLLLIVAHAKQSSPESKKQAVSSASGSVIEILKKEKSSQRLWDSGSQFAQVYTKSGLLVEGEELLQALRSQVIFGDSSISSSIGTLDPRTWIFIVSFQTTLHHEQLDYTTVMADLINEVFLYSAYRRTINQKSPFLDTLAYGARLLQFMREIKDEPSGVRVERELLEYFATNLSAPKSTSPSALRSLFEIVLRETQGQDLDITVLKAGTSGTVDSYDKGQYAEAHDVAFLTDRFQQFVGGYGSSEKIVHGLKLALALAGYRTKSRVTDAKVKATLWQLSGQIMKQIIQGSRDGHVLLVDIPLTDLNAASGLLRVQGNMIDLEYLLTTLWEARTTQPTWPASTIVSLGRRLVETHFARSHHAFAIHLLEDMCYNLHLVWGALDATTLEMHVLLSEFYTSDEQYRKAMQVHEDVLRDTVSDKGDDLEGNEAASIAVRHLELLRRAYQRLGSWDKEKQVYVDLYQQLAHVFGGEEAWKAAKIEDVEKWSKAGAKGDNLGIWVTPEVFEWMESGEQRKHANYLWKSLGRANGFAIGGAGIQFHGGRLTRTYSARSLIAK